MINPKHNLLVICMLFLLNSVLYGQVNKLPQQISSDPKLSGLFVDSLYIVNAVENERAGYLFIELRRDKFKELVEKAINDSIQSFVSNSQKKTMKGSFELEKVYEIPDCEGACQFYFHQDIKLFDSIFEDKTLIYTCKYKLTLHSVGSPEDNDTIVTAHVKIGLVPQYSLDSYGNINITVKCTITGTVFHVNGANVDAHFPDYDDKGVTITWKWGVDPINKNYQTRIPSLEKLLDPYKNLVSDFFLNISNSYIIFFTPIKNEN